MVEFYFIMKCFAVVLCLCIVVPLMTYMVVKMGTFGFFMARKQFHEDQDKGED
jgi:hypothetical protein